MSDNTNDTGAKRVFSTGATRDTAKGKPRYTLIPPCALRRIAEHYTRGAEKHGARNWELGIPIMDCADSLMRHIQAWLDGQANEDHLAAAAWNINAIIFNEEMIKRGQLPATLDDRPAYMKQGQPDSSVHDLK